QTCALPISAGIAGFAPGLVGYGLFAVLSRALYARGDTGRAALAAVAGWAAVAVAAVALAALLPAAHRVLALTVANSVGMAVLGAALLAGVFAGAARAASAGVGRDGLVGLLAAVWATAGGRGVVEWIRWGEPPAVGAVVGSGMLAGGVVGAVFGVGAWALDGRDVRPMAAAAVSRLARRPRPRRPSTGS